MKNTGFILAIKRKIQLPHAARENILSALANDSCAPHWQLLCYCLTADVSDPLPVLVT